MNTSKSITRVITGFIIGLMALFAILSGGLYLMALILVIVVLASKEYTLILKHKGFLPSFKIILFSSLFFALLAYFNLFNLLPLAFTVATITSFMWVLFRGKQPYIANVATTILGFVYCGWFPLHLIFFRNLECAQYDSGLGFVIMMLACIISTDVGCYYVGTRWGKHKLAPTVSPNKSIEGSIGGAVCSVLMAEIIGIFFLGISWWLSLIAGLICTTFAQIGDLCESLLKRDAGVKDSGDSLPGHGGFLDRTDSFALTIPIMYYFVKYFIFKTEWMGATVEFIKGFLH